MSQNMAEEVVNVLGRIYNNMAIAYTLEQDITDKIHEKKFDCEWDELLYRLFTYFFYFRGFLNDAREWEETFETEELSESFDSSRLLEMTRRLMPPDKQKLLYPKWMERFPPFDLLKFNLTWKLMLDLNKMSLDSTPMNLISLYRNHGRTGKDSSQLSRKPIKEYPRTFRRSFGIKFENSHYMIKTPFPKLLITLIEHQNALPFQVSCDKPVLHTWKKDISLYQECLSTIVCDNKWTQESFMAYYLFEHLFRYNAKIRLFFRHEELGKAAKLKEEKLRSSIKEVSNLFFHSQLVYIPDAYILPMASFNDDRCCINAFRLMSSYYFPAMLCAAKYIISKMGRYTYKKFVDYVFPSEQWNEWCRYYSEYIPASFGEKDLYGRSQHNRYRDIWCDFHPNGCFSKTAHLIQYI